MNWNISAWCIRNPIPPIILFVLLTIAGVTAYMGLGIEENPNIDSPYVTVNVRENGAAPFELEAQITRKVEDAVSGVSGVKHIFSHITSGLSNTVIEFELGTNSDRATTDIREAITGIRSTLPKGIEEPQIIRDDFDDGSWITYTVFSSKRSPMELSWIIDNDMTNALLAAPSIGHVYRSGGADRQISVNLDPVRLEAYGVTADIINSQLHASNIDLPGGRGNIASAEETIRTLGSARSLQALRDTRIMLANNRWVALGSLGTVEDGPGETRRAAQMNGKDVIIIDISRKRGKNVVDAENDAEKIITDLEKRFPDIKCTRIYSDAKHVKESCNATFESLLIGAFLAVIVIFLFLKDWRAALIAAVAMPLSIIPTFAFMKAANFTLNDMSLLGLALVIGILVDDAIVEIENIVRHINLGKKPFFAAIDAADEIGLAVVATTMAAVVVFLPVAFMGGKPGQFFRQFGFTVSVAVFCSLLVARLITPLMAAYWLNQKQKHDKPGKLAYSYERFLKTALKHRLTTVIVGLVFFGASLGLFQLLPTSLVSRIDKGHSMVYGELPSGSSIKETTELAQRLTKICLGHPEVETVSSTIGENGINNCRLFVILKPKEQRKLSQDEFEAALRPELAAVPGAHISFGGGWGSGRADILLTSLDSEALDATANQLAKEMADIPKLTDVHIGAGTLNPEIIVQPDIARASEQGVSAEAIARTALIATIGDSDANRPKFDVKDRQIPIVVQLNPKFLNKMSVISNLKVAGANGKLVPLSSVATVSISSGLGKIDRYDRARRANIYAKFGSDFTLGEALKAIHALPAYAHKPSSVKENLTGDAETQRDVFGGFGYAIVTGVLLIYAVLVILFRGFLQPFTIMMSLPLSLGGALIGLWLFHKPIDMYALIGIVMLMGLVTKNAILLVEYCLTARARGMEREEALFTAGRTRMRPILMTTTAMIAGMLPIASGLGAGAEARSPMAIAVVGGLFMSTLLTLLVVPVVFTYMDDLQQFILKAFNHPDADEDRRNRLGAALPREELARKLNADLHIEPSSTSESSEAKDNPLQQI